MELTLSGVVAIVAVSIMLSVAVIILGQIGNSFDCKTVDGYNASGSDDAAKYPSGTWAGTCKAVQEQSQSGIALLVVVIILIAAVVLLGVVRMMAH